MSINCIKNEIQKLKEEKNAVILAHYYVLPEIQEIADYVGDSFYLSKTASGLSNPIIVYFVSPLPQGTFFRISSSSPSNICKI